MSTPTWLVPLFQVGFGFLVFWIFAGWSALEEILAPDFPGREAGRFPFVAGQAVALVGVVLLAQLCGLLLGDFARQTGLRSVAGLAASLLFGLEAVWILRDSPLHRPERTVPPTFEGGRDLALHHAPGLFLTLGLLVALGGANGIPRLAIGIVLGWGMALSLRGLPWPPSARRRTRRVLAALAVLAGLLLLPQALR